MLFLLAAVLTLPSNIPQGETLHVETREPTAVTTRMGDRSVRLFQQPDGARLGLLPVPVDENPGTYKVEVLDGTGNVLQSANVEVKDANFPIQNIRVSRATKAIRPLPGEMEAVSALRKTVSGTRYWTEPFAAPAPECMNSPFGVKRYHNGQPTGNYHRGIDQRSPPKRAIHAASDGRVRIARMFRLHGGTVGIDHGQGLTTIYLHMSAVAAKEDQLVKKGDVIGYVGSTGFATGPHLHWQLAVNGVPVNPLQWVKNIESCTSPSRR